MTDLTRPIVGIENRTAQEVFDIMVDRFRRQATPVDNVSLALKKADEALRPLTDAVYNDNGDMTVTVPLLTSEECIQGYFASKRIADALQGIPPADHVAPSPADQIIGQIEELFPNWRSYRDLVDCITCELHELRKRAEGK